MLPTAPNRRHPPPREPRPARLRRLAFDLLYGPAAPVYDLFTAWLFLGEWSRWQRTAIPFLPQTGLVVELGAGTGALARAAAQPGRAWLAVEPSRSMLRAARRRPLPAACRLVRATASALPLPDGRGDAVVATFPGPYLFSSATALELRRVLRPGGRLVVVLDGRLAPNGPRRRFRRAALHAFYGSGSGTTPDVSIPGFSGSLRTVQTPHGTAMLWIGTTNPVPATSLRAM